MPKQKGYGGTKQGHTLNSVRNYFSGIAGMFHAGATKTNRGVKAANPPEYLQQGPHKAKRKSK